MAKILKLFYAKIPQIDPLTQEKIGEILRPLVEIKLSSNDKFSTPVNALIDSGSDGNLFPLRFGERLGINFKKQPMRAIFGIGNSTVIVYQAKIDIWLGNDKFETTASFSNQQEQLLLGRNGFSNLFQKIIFNEQSETVELVFKD